ncbi:hypothetical protein ZWY2020_028319 [Hordeum vulgare]|nr:hypothetical protein ZWY2020_028319 [Hordeum vulgare]
MPFVRADGRAPAVVPAALARWLTGFASSAGVGHRAQRNRAGWVDQGPLACSPPCAMSPSTYRSWVSCPAQFRSARLRHALCDLSHSIRIWTPPALVRSPAPPSLGYLGNRYYLSGPCKQNWISSRWMNRC